MSKVGGMAVDIPIPTEWLMVAYEVQISLRVCYSSNKRRLAMAFATVFDVALLIEKEKHGLRSDIFMMKITVASYCVGPHSLSTSMHVVFLK